MLPERAPSEGPRSTAAVKSSSLPCLVGTERGQGYEWTRAVEDQSAPIPGEITSKLGGGISRDVLDGGFGTSKRHQPSEPLAPPRSPSSYAALLGMMVGVSVGFYGGGYDSQTQRLRLDV